MSSHWTLVDVVADKNGLHREVVTETSEFFRRVLDDLLPSDSVVLRSGNDFCLDLVEFGERHPWTEPLPWHLFIKELQPAQVA